MAGDSQFLATFAGQLEEALGETVRDPILVTRRQDSIIRCSLRDREAAVRLSHAPLGPLTAVHRLIVAVEGRVLVNRLLVPQPVPLVIDGESLLASVFAWEQGVSLDLRDTEYYDAAASTLTAIHSTDGVRIRLSKAPIERPVADGFLNRFGDSAARTIRSVLRVEIPGFLAPIHGDAVARNFIRSPRGAVLIDFADAGMGHPEHDVAAVLYQAIRSDAPALWTRFTTRYRALGGPAQLEELVLYRALTRYILFIAQWLQQYVAPLHQIDQGRYLRWIDEFLCTERPLRRFRMS